MYRSLLMLTVASTVLLTACLPEKEKETVQENNATLTQEKVQIDGSFAYRERIALPPNAYAVVALNNVTRADRPAVMLTKQNIDLNGKSVPIQYNLVAENITLNPDMNYAIKIDIRDADGTVLFTNNPAQKINSTKSIQTLDSIILQQAATDEADQDTDLIGTTWTIEDINKQGIIDSSNISFIFSDEGLVGGFSGCNNFNMPFEDVNGVLEFGSSAGTLKACAPALMNQERKFLQIFSAVKTYSFDDTNALILKTEDGQSLTARSNS